MSPSYLARRLLQLRHASRIHTEEIELSSTVGYKLAARITRPSTPDRAALVISPAIHQGIDALEGPQSPVSPSEIAALGYTVLSFDPAGRGKSWGTEDFGGPEHQDDLRVAIRTLSERMSGAVGVLSLSMGVVAAVGALSKYRELQVRWLLDWEGPSDREILTAGGTRMVPADGHTLEDEEYWRHREPVGQLGKLPCAYVRLQGVPDHAQPLEVRHAERMMRAAAAGSLPWFQLNDHPHNQLPARPLWHPGGALSARRVILRKLNSLSALFRDF